MNKLAIVLLSMIVSVVFSYPSVAAIYVENFPENVTVKDVKSLFAEHGRVMKVQLVKGDSQKAEGQQNGFVHMGNFSMELKAVKALNGKIVGGKLSLIHI